MNQVIAYIGLGSNLDKPIQQINMAVDTMDSLPFIKLVTLSPLYQNPPLGNQQQPDYVNAVAKIVVSCPVTELLTALNRIESIQGRIRITGQWGIPRTIDLDILLYGDITINTDKLTIPHSGLTTRNFVLAPLYDIEPDLILPDGQCIADLLANCDISTLQKMDDAINV